MKTICLPLFLAGIILGQDNELQRYMEGARAHVQRLESSVPNFVCDEQIISRAYDKQKVRKETRAEAVLTTTRSVKEGHGTFAETRAQMRINGKPSAKNEISGPFVWSGGPAYGDLHFLFNSTLGAKCLNHTLVGPVKLGNKDALLIETHAPENVEYDDACSDLRPDSADRIWIDPTTLNVMRVESHDPPATRIPGTDLTLTVEYAAVSFDGQEYWLPSHFISRLDFPGTPRYMQYEAFFSNYHKYTAESSFHVDPDQ